MKITKFFKKYFFSSWFLSFLRVTLIISLILTIYYKEWLSVLITILTLVSSYFDKFFMSKWIKVPIELTVIIVVFIYLTIFLWDVWGLYTKYYWRDSLYHFLSWVILWLIWFIILNTLFKAYNINSPIFIICFFSFCFAVSIWALWEICEFAFDEFFWLDSQSARWLVNSEWIIESRLWVVDTMKDIILNTSWALISTLIWYKYLKNWESFKWFDYIVRKSEKLNINFFKKSKS